MNITLTRSQACALLTLLSAATAAEYNATKTGRMRPSCDPKHLRELFQALTSEAYDALSRKGFAGLSSEMRTHLRSNRVESRVIALPYAVMRVFRASPAFVRHLTELIPNFRVWHRLFAAYYANPPVIEGVLALRHQTRALRPLAPDISGAISGATNGVLNR